jgi:hypothetical protein
VSPAKSGTDVRRQSGLSGRRGKITLVGNVLFVEECGIYAKCRYLWNLW